MGTRGLVGMVVDKKKKAMYNHFDSYPDGLGDEVVNFVKSINGKNDTNSWTNFHKNASKLKAIKKITPSLVERYSKFSDTSVASQSIKDAYCLFRNLQGVPFLEYVFSGELNHYSDDSGFLKDSLFCEYAYFINFDKMKLECYEGFQKLKTKGKDGRNKYGVCKLVGSFPLTNIPDNWKDCYKKDEDNNE